LVYVQAAALEELDEQPPPDFLPLSGLGPLLEPAVAGLVGRIAARQIGPGGTGAKNPEDPIDDRPVVLPGTPSSRARALGLGQKRLE